MGSLDVDFLSEDHPVPFSYEVDDDGFAVVHKHVLATQFWLENGTLFLEREVYNANGNLLKHTFQKLSQTAQTTQWRVPPGRYRVLSAP